MSLTKGEKEYAYYIRKGSVTVRAKDRDIEMTIPDKPRSSKQKYRLTAKGKKKVKSEKLKMKS